MCVCASLHTHVLAVLSIRRSTKDLFRGFRNSPKLLFRRNATQTRNEQEENQGKILTLSLEMVLVTCRF